MIYKLDIAEVI